MANTFTSNYSLIKSEIGGDNQAWGSNLHTDLDEIDLELGSKVDDVDLKGFTSTVLTFTNTGTNTGTIASSSGDLFQNFKVGDKIRVSGCGSATNGSAVAPKTHTLTSPISANSITVSTGLVSESGDTVIVALVLEPKLISGGPIVCAPPTGDTTTQALVATGSATIGGATTDDLVVTASVNSNLIPKTDATHDLGSNAKQWNDLHVTGTANIDALVSDGTFALSGSGTVAGVTVTSSGSEIGSAHKTVNLAVTGVSGSYTNFNMGSNGQGAKTVSTSAPSSTTGYANGDVWFEIP
jgi:hypothetical protein